jgi:hypothetical protein
VRLTREYLSAAASAADRCGDPGAVGARLRDLGDLVPGDGDLNVDDRRAVTVYLVAAANCAQDHGETVAVEERLRLLAAHEATLYGRAVHESQRLTSALGV